MIEALKVTLLFWNEGTSIEGGGGRSVKYSVVTVNFKNNLILKSS